MSIDGAPALGDDDNGRELPELTTSARDGRRTPKTTRLRFEWQRSEDFAGAVASVFKPETFGKPESDLTPRRSR